MRVFKGETFAEAYNYALGSIIHNPTYVSSPRGMKIFEMTDAAIVVEDPTYCLYENDRRSSQFKYIAAELVWYFTGRNDADFITPYAKFWDQIKNKDGTVNSAYGNLIFTEELEDGRNQYRWALDSLIQDKDSRQAIIHFNKPSHQWNGNKDFVCTLNGIFQIRDNKLNFTIDMRSNDLILGTPTDVAFFCLLQIQMLEHLRKYYPELELGTYTHIAHSLHLYERHFDLASEMLMKSFNPQSFPDMREFLIDPNGKALDGLKQLEDDMIQSNDIVFQGNSNFEPSAYDDLLHQWISDAIFNKIF
jgi:thymidylate synthase